jgi:hypothetical protein
MANKQLTGEEEKVLVERARGCCEYCRSQERFAMQSFSVEHVIPRSKGGKTALNNVAFACQGCNNHKYTKTKAKDPKTGKMVALFHPRKQQWRDHFAWNNEGTLIIGLTATGRASIAALQLKRPGLINLRRVLAAAGEHPPPEGGTDK